MDGAGRLGRRRVARHEVQPAAGACRRAAACTRSASASFFFRGGPYDFSCASCHGEDGKRIRLQDLPNLTKNPGDGIGFAAWPAYRVCSGELWGMQRRLNDCYRQQRFPYPGFGVGRDDRARRLHGRQRQGRRVDRAVDQALRSDADPASDDARAAARPPRCCAAPAAPSLPSTRRARRADRGDDEGVVPRPGHRQGRPPRAGPRRSAPARRRAAPLPTTWPRRSRARRWRPSSGRPTAATSATGARARSSRRTAAA